MIIDRRKWAGILIPLLLIVTVAVGGCSSNEKSSFISTDELLTSLYQNGNFVFEGLPWFSSREDVVEQQKIDDSKAADFLITEGSIALDKGSLTRTVIYRFSDEEFVSGEYLFSASDKEQFTSFVNDVKTYLAEALPKPKGNDLSVLDQAGDQSAQGNVVSWEAPDKSRLSITILGKRQDVGSTYDLLIKSSAPLDAKEGLSP